MRDEMRQMMRSMKQESNDIRGHRQPDGPPESTGRPVPPASGPTGRKLRKASEVGAGDHGPNVKAMKEVVEVLELEGDPEWYKSEKDFIDGIVAATTATQLDGAIDANLPEGSTKQNTKPKKVMALYRHAAGF